MAMVADLSLHRQAIPRRYAKPQREYFETTRRNEGPPSPRTLEDRRTYLGCYYLTVV
jgi:hypothetical protein